MNYLYLFIGLSQNSSKGTKLILFILKTSRILKFHLTLTITALFLNQVYELRTEENGAKMLSMGEKSLMYYTGGNAHISSSQFAALKEASFYC